MRYDEINIEILQDSIKRLNNNILQAEPIPASVKTHVRYAVSSLGFAIQEYINEMKKYREEKSK